MTPEMDLLQSNSQRQEQHTTAPFNDTQNQNLVKPHEANNLSDEQQPTASTSPAADHSSLKSSMSSSSNNDPEVVGSLFSYGSHLLQPFMGLRPTTHASDPWYHKAYDLHRPIFHGGGSYEPYLSDGRYKRNIKMQPTTSHNNKNVLTPHMLDRLLKIKVDFEKTFPHLYKTLLDSYRSENRTRITIKPPVIPQQIEYPVLELAAAEKDPIEVTKSAEYNEEREEQPTADEDDVIDYFHFDDADE